MTSNRRSAVARRAALAALSIAALAGCGARRPAGIAGPPVDLVARIDKERLEQLVANAETQLAVEQEYYLGPGDVVAFQLLGRSDIFQGGGGGNAQNGGQQEFVFTLTDSPYMSFPLIGAVRVHDKTAAQLQEDLKAAYGSFVRNPEPLVIVREFARNRVTVLGSVATSGEQPYQFGDTVLDAIFRAGGLSLGGRGGGSAPGRFLKIYRQKLSGEQRAKMSLEEMIQAVTEDGRVLPREEITIPIDDLLLNGVLSYNIPLRQDDILYVPPAGTINMQGYVSAPGITFLGPSLKTVGQAVTERGGLRVAGTSKVEVVRTYPDGQRVSYFVDARRVVGHSQPDFIIRDGDEVFVYTTLPREALEGIQKLISGSLRAGANYTYTPGI